MYFIKAYVSNKQNENLAYCVYYNEKAHEITASTIEELSKNVRDRHKINNEEELIFQYWSDKYQDWILMDTMPSQYSKIKVIINQDIR